MKLKLLLLLFFITAFSVTAKPVIIKGKINGKLPETLYFTAPVNGDLGFNNYYTVVPDAQGNFTITTDLAEISFIDISYNYQQAGFIVAEPGNEYGITITESEGKVTHVITGKAIEGQALYNNIVNMNRTGLSQNIAMETTKIESVNAFKENYKKKEQEDIAAFKKLLDAKSISKDFFDAVVAEQKYFYAGSMAVSIYIKFAPSENEINPKSLKDFSDLWGTLYAEINLADKRITKSPSGKLVLDFYKGYKEFEQAGFDFKNITLPTDEIAIINNIETVIPSQNLEYYLAVRLHFAVFEGQKNKSAITAYEYFKKKFPESAFTKYLTPEMATVISFFSEDRGMPANAAFVENYSAINSVAELIKKFPGKKLYFDVWATWCGPCRDEFKYKEELYKLLKANDITVIYLSVDKDEKEEMWKKMISFYGLEGYHLRANKALDNNISYLFSGGRDLALPWYFIANSKGEIAIKYAPAPSNIEKLQQEIKKI